ncbi:hypothetical protein BpHYR1_032840 [Brachionus plicatilis]|uniref:Uncharacterized protein n=1 Tax=Brachionus plicatilis TaxID=10195 RepID=A0A3M7QNT9_BRAPC|nr:hypothetical protein BpHYR1_032840 [Brachionus plicatilis]
MSAKTLQIQIKTNLYAIFSSILPQLFFDYSSTISVGKEKVKEESRKRNVQKLPDMSNKKFTKS